MEFTIHSKMWSQKLRQKIISALPPLTITQWQNAPVSEEQAFLSVPTIGILLLRRYFPHQLRPFQAFRLQLPVPVPKQEEAYSYQSLSLKAVPTGLKLLKNTLRKEELYQQPLKALMKKTLRSQPYSCSSSIIAIGSWDQLHKRPTKPFYLPF